MASRLGAYLSLAFVVAAGVYGAALGGHLAAWQTTIAARTQTALIAGGLGINEVVVKGRDHTARARIDEALDVSDTRTIFGFDTRAAKKRLEQIGWVKSARVMRLWPSTLVVELSERRPYARWDIRGHTVLIDKKGELLGPVTPEFSDLPRVAGEGANTAAVTLFETLEEQDAVARRVSVVRRVEHRRWDLVLNDGMRAQLPARGVASALPLLARLLDGELPEGVTAIDMRVPGRVALRRSAPDTDAPGPTAQVSDGMSRVQAQAL